MPSLITIIEKYKALGAKESEIKIRNLTERSHRFWRQRTESLFVTRYTHFAVFSRKDAFVGCETDSSLLVQYLVKTTGEVVSPSHIS